ncbi:MAG: choice-of-anchor N protein [Gammaproteobacteria bacterium]|nr:choice-of-anchor N protein [Gammaproteobacteria bacterium]
MQKFSSLVLALSAFSFSQVVLAIPSLQLDIDGGFYDAADESTLTNSSSFILRAFGNPGSPKFDLSSTFYLSAAVIQNHDSVADGTNFGSFSIDGDSYAFGDSDVYYGVPPVDSDVDPDLNTAVADLSKHSIYPTIFSEVSFMFSASDTIGAYNVQDDSTGAGIMYQMAFDIDASTLLAGYDLHFDLYTYDQNDKKIKIDYFAPFSHDAATSIAQVPEPAILALFGLGFIGLGLVRRKQK